MSAADQNIYIHLVAGGVAGTTGAILTCPLEVVKTRFQACPNTHSISSLNNNHSKRPISIQTNSIRSLHSKHYNLNHPHSYSLTSNSSSSVSSANKPYSNILFRHSYGATTSTANSLVANDLNFNLSNFHKNQSNNNLEFTVKNQKNTNFNTYRFGRNILYTIKSIIENEGYRALFKGLGPNIIGVAPYRAIYFFTYANSKNYLASNLGEERPIIHVLAAFLAGFSAVTITNPIWFVKTRLQLDQTRRGQTALECINRILKEKGPLGFYKGISASYFGITESALYFVIYEKLKSLAANRSPGSSDDNLTLLNYFTSAGFSKTLASIICYPHEVARTRLRQEGNKYTGFFQTLSLIMHEEGVKGMYKGMATHMIRQIPNTAIVMTSYELIVHHFCKNDNSFPLGNDDE